MSNHPSNPKGLAAKNVFNKRNIKLISFQHGVSAEISESHSNLLSQHDSSSSDQYFAFNNAAASVAKKNPFNVAKNFVYGLPKRYKRQRNIFKFRKKYPILFLSNKLYRGNDGRVHTWINDYEFFIIESNLIKIISTKLNKQVFYKPYPASFNRYEERDPILEEIDSYKNVHIIKNNKDARFLIGNSKLIICTTASSTFSWAIMSNVPVIFINFPNVAPLKKEAIKYFDEGLFLFDYNSKISMRKLVNLLSLNFTDINKIWKEKITYRKKLIQTFISSTQNLVNSDIFRG